MSAGQAAGLDLFFSADLLPRASQDALGADFQIRPLARTDYALGHLDVLQVLTIVPDTGEAAWQQRFDEMRTLSDTYFPIVIVRTSDDRILGCGTLFIERKFIRNLGTVGHIEDIAVARAAQGRSLGRTIIEALVGVSERVGTYKTILDCNKNNIPFYEKCGFDHKDFQLVRYGEGVPCKK